jgi:EAL domain-containing protein (putative c-di-GMP-specific phosphodiesterase class I)
MGAVMLGKTLSGGSSHAAAARHIGTLVAATGEAVAALVVQVDSLDRINQSQGLATGDAVLAEIAQRLERFAAEELGHDGLVIRLDGPRFMLVPPPAMRPAALAAQQRALHAALAQPLIGDPNGRLVIRLANAEFSSGQSFEQQLKIAAEALRRPSAKRDGAQVGAAMANDEIVFRFQPQISMASGEIVGAEALLRWQHPELGLLGAAPLVTAATSARLDRQLTEHAHRVTLREVAQWPEALGNLRVALNITAPDLGDDAFAVRFGAMLQEFGLAPDRFTLELTEQAMLADPARAAGQLSQLRDLGCRIAVDDFGTGYSSLSLLAQLPLDYLKIDGGFTRALDRSERDRIVVRAIAELARALGLTIVAEGVETETQRDQLAEMGVDIWQGFLCAGPVCSKELASLAKDYAQAPSPIAPH